MVGTQTGRDGVTVQLLVVMELWQEVATVTTHHQQAMVQKIAQA